MIYYVDTPYEFCWHEDITNTLPTYNKLMIILFYYNVRQQEYDQRFNTCNNEYTDMVGF